jgi:hypothetical protein
VIQQTGKKTQTGHHSEPCGFKMEIPAPAIFVQQHGAVAGSNRMSRSRDWQREQGPGVHIANLTPVEPWVRDDYLPATDNQSDERNHCNPGRHARDRGKP